MRDGRPGPGAGTCPQRDAPRERFSSSATSRSPPLPTRWDGSSRVTWARPGEPRGRTRRGARSLDRPVRARPGEGAALRRRRGGGRPPPRARLPRERGDYVSSASAWRTFARCAWSSVVFARSASPRSRFSFRSRSRRRSSLPVRSSIASCAARASSSAESAVSSGSVAARHERRAEAAVDLHVEVLRRQLGEEADERGVRDASRERVALEPSARIEKTRSVGRRGGLRPSPRRRETRDGLLRQVEPVLQEPERLLALGRVLGPRRGPRARARTPPGDRTRDRARAAPDRRCSSRPRGRRSSNPSGASAGSCPGGSATTRTSKPRAVASSIPRSVASCPAASASKQRKSFRVVRSSRS